MRAVNHAVTGALIGLISGDVLVAVPIAVASHFVMDMIPHHGLNEDDKPTLLRKPVFKYLIYGDAILCFLLVLALIIFKPQYWILAIICAFAAAAPDFLSFNRYIKALRHQPWKPGLYSTFASKIQWFERPIGAVVECLWLTAALVLLVPML
jgi:hypothetical protein